MASRSRTISRAWLNSPNSGAIELVKDWHGGARPPVAVCHGVACVVLATITRPPEHEFGFESGYFAGAEGGFYFVLPLARVPWIDPAQDAVYVGGDFNGWQEAVGREEWCLTPAEIGGEKVLLWSGEAKRFESGQRFKFVTSRHQWIGVPADAPNGHRDDGGNVNHQLDLHRTGRHLFRFTVGEPLDLTESWSVGWEGVEATVPLRLGAFFRALRTELPLGAIVHPHETTFRLFAPRAQRVELSLCRDLGAQANPYRYALRRRPEAGGQWTGVWEITLEDNLHGCFYWYSVAGPGGPFSHFDPAQRILDPYALAAVDREGPGIVIDRAQIAAPDTRFRTPEWQDLVIAEAHVRDLATHAPIRISPAERQGFHGLTRWVQSPQFHLARLGINAVELLPVAEFDNATPEEYHWGYMPVNYFAPESSYSSAPAEASGIRELQELVQAFHQRGQAVILDVVYNHVGLPAHLLFIDKLYYFELNDAGELTNWSGCGNDLCCRSAMTVRLIVDSLTYLIQTYGVDGFRFDLAELIGVDALRRIELELKRVKPDVVLIAEPWSFRGHIAADLRDSGFASWNDGYRDFVREYVLGGGTAARLEYHLKGSPWHFAKWPAQTVNYTESHDDRAWIDLITENPGFQGMRPTETDRRRTHLMAAILFSSIGIPMIAAGQDFLRSKQGVHNTYQRGDLNALDYRRIFRYPATHEYFADWIAFRRSETGRLLRHYSRVSDGFFRFFAAASSTAVAVVFNADGTAGRTRLLLAINPGANEVTLPLDEEVSGWSWRQLADTEHFFGADSHGTPQPVELELFVPAIGCGLWVAIT